MTRQQNWWALIPATILFQGTLLALIVRGRRPGLRGPMLSAGSARRNVTGVRADAWLLAEALADLASDAPAPRPRDEATFTIVSRRNGAPLEAFGSEDAANQALWGVTRQHPHLHGRFTIVQTRLDDPD